MCPNFEIIKMFHEVQHLSEFTGLDPKPCRHPNSKTWGGFSSEESLCCCSWALICDNPGLHPVQTGRQTGGRQKKKATSAVYVLVISGRGESVWGVCSTHPSPVSAQHAWTCHECDVMVSSVRDWEISAAVMEPFISCLLARTRMAAFCRS